MKQPTSIRDFLSQCLSMVTSKGNLSAFIAIIVMLITWLNSMLPYNASHLWLMICWAGLLPIIAIVIYAFFFFTTGMFSKKEVASRATNIARSKFKFSLTVWLGPLVIALGISYFFHELPAYPTLYFAQTPFELQAKVSSARCKAASAITPIYTAIYFTDTKTQASDNIYFFKNLCEEEPDTISDLPHKIILLKGREWLFGKIYDEFTVDDKTIRITKQNKI